MIRKLVLFDIDGTLIATRGVGRRAIRAALAAEIGADGPFDQVLFDGKTDPQIVRELLELAPPQPRPLDASITAICARYVDLLATELTRGPLPEVFPGVEGLLEFLHGRGDLVVGLLTGNVMDGARLKLNAAGLPFDRFVLGAFGSDHPARDQLPPIAADRARTVMGRVPAGPDVVIIGDTPADMTCGRGIGARAIGVATGSFDVDALLEAGAYAAVRDLSDPEPVVAAIDA